MLDPDSEEILTSLIWTSIYPSLTVYDDAKNIILNDPKSFLNKIVSRSLRVLSVEDGRLGDFMIWIINSSMINIKDLNGALLRTRLPFKENKIMSFGKSMQ